MHLRFKLKVFNLLLKEKHFRQIVVTLRFCILSFNEFSINVFVDCSKKSKNIFHIAANRIRNERYAKSAIS